ncbi:hypothetical protein HUG10_20710 (plasmid) [Halorarum halophilum]|uniref:C2H2-type domain-containing protein n=1 Tax=Halorarum halophilum TaxID=2743090 RepID=A0A7D5GIM8_9EURY|nr:C2H2-type zinc finger protein [Halobaculum halophilum]QLG30030.1 hypothetical protein HUG10_20710 [Halobaculum halophilum]
MSDVDEWKENNESFSYDPPDADPEMWSPEEFTELYDRVIGRQVKWICEHCSQPFPSLDAARRHVRTQHSVYLIGQAKLARDDD